MESMGMTTPKTKRPIPWKSRSRHNKCIIISIVCIVFICIFNLIGLVAFYCVFKRHEQNLFIKDHFRLLEEEMNVVSSPNATIIS